MVPHFNFLWLSHYSWKRSDMSGMFTFDLVNCFFWRNLHYMFLLIEEFFITCFYLWYELFMSSYWRTFHHLFLLIEGDFSVFLQGISSLVSSYWKDFSLSVHWSSSDQFNPVLSHWHIPGILLQFLDLLLGRQLQNIVFFINFFMTEEVVLMSRAKAEQERNPQRGQYV